MSGDSAAGAARPGLTTQLVRFVLVGGFSAVVDLTVYSLGLHVGLSTYVARALSFVVGTTTAYALNRRWAFQVEGGARRAGGFALLYGTTFFLILGVNALALAVLPESSSRRSHSTIRSGPRRLRSALRSRSDQAR